MQRVVTALALAVAILGVAVGVIAAQSSTATVEVRIQAMRLDDGRVEFALQQREGDGWGERILPRARYFPSSSQGRWLSSSPVDVSVPLSATVAAPTATATPAPASTLPFEGEGEVGEVSYWTRRDELTDALSTTLLVLTSYTDDYGLKQTASYAIACASSETVATWLGSDEYHVDDQVSVTYRVDSRPAVTERWHVFGTLRDAVTPAFLDVSATNAVINRLRAGDTLRIRTPETPVLTFDISQLFDTPAQVNIDRCLE